MARKGIGRSISFFSLLAVFSVAFSISFWLGKMNAPVGDSKAESLENVGVNSNLKVNVPIVLSLRLDKGSLNLNGSGEGFISAKNTAFVSTNAVAGHKVILSSNNEETDLTHTTVAEQKFASINEITPRDNFPNKNWGYSLDSYNYLPIPKLSGASIIKEVNSFSAAEVGVDFYVGVKLGEGLVSGTYSRPLIITALANPDPERTFSGITTMQQMTASICENETTPHAFVGGGTSGTILSATTRTHTTDKNFIPEAELTDTRDGKKYTIRKLADGNCWMVKNLDLGVAGQSINLTSADTDIASSFTLNNIGNPGHQFSTDESSNQVAVIDNGNKWLIDVSQGSDEAVSTSEPSDPELKLRHIGNYYSWYAATAGSGSYSMSSGNASYSICPKGWRLPFGENTNTNKSFHKLTEKYGLTNGGSDGGGTSSYKFRSKPFSFPFSGYYRSTSVHYQGINGWFWSSTVYSSDHARHLSCAIRGLGPRYYNMEKMHGFAIRCVAR